MIDRYGVFTASEEDVCELGVMSVPRCVIYTKSFREFIKNLERLSGRLVKNVQHLFIVIIVEEPSTKIEKY